MLPPDIRSALTGKRVFMTGATGLFGRWILSELSGIDLELVLLTRDPASFVRSFPAVQNRNMTLVKGDARDFADPSGRFDLIVHAATPVVSDSLSDDELTAVIVAGTERVLRFAARCDCERLLYVSSGAVYGNPPETIERIPETLRCEPISAYGRAKLIAEGLCSSSDIHCVIARCFAFVGPGMPLNAHFAIGNFIGNCLRDERIQIKGDGTPLRSYMHCSDLVEWLMTMLLRGSRSEIYHVGSEEAISIKDLALKVREVLSAGSPIEVGCAAVGNQVIQRYVPSNRKARESLGLRVNVDLDLAIRLAAGGAVGG